MPAWMTEATGTLAAVLGTVCWLPQSIKTIMTRETASLSLWSNLLLLATVCLWFLYGLAIGSWPLMGANAVSIVLVGVIVGMKLRHG
jgi:MtN3 and saliva related transmembrane protein